MACRGKKQAGGPVKKTNGGAVKNPKMRQGGGLGARLKKPKDKGK